MVEARWLTVVALVGLCVTPALGDVPKPTGMNTDAPLVEAVPVAPLANSSLSPQQEKRRPPAWACTIASVAKGRPCLLEGEQPPSQNAKRRRDDEFVQLREQLCAHVATRADTTACSLIVDRSASVCGAPRRSPLLDDQGRFATDAGPCVAALREAADTVQTLLDEHRPCCSCLAGAQATRPATGQCLEGIAQGSMPPSLDEARCSESCAALLLRRPSQGSTAPSTPLPREASR